MSRLSRVTILMVVVAGGVYGVLFCLANSAAVGLDLVFARLPEAPLSVWVLGAFVAGGLLGLLASSAALWRMRMAAAALRREAAHSETTASTADTRD